MSVKRNNAQTILAWSLQASGTNFVVKTGEWDLFPSSNFQVTLQQKTGTTVKKREILQISSRTADVFQISVRASQACVQDDAPTSGTKTRTQNALSFLTTDWDVEVFQTITEEEFNALETEIFTGISEDITNANNTLRTELKSEIQKQSVVYGASSTWNDDYAITLDPVPSTLADLQGSIYFLADVWNEWTATLNINNLWAKTIKKKNDTDLDTGDIEANQKVEVVYNSSDDVFEMVSQEASVVDVQVDNLKTEILLAWEVIWANKFVRYGQEKAVSETWWAETSNSGFFWPWDTVFSFTPNYHRIDKITLRRFSAWNASSWDTFLNIYDNSWTLLYTSDASPYIADWNYMPFVFTDANLTIWATYSVRITYSTNLVLRFYSWTGWVGRTLDFTVLENKQRLYEASTSLQHKTEQIIWFTQNGASSWQAVKSIFEWMVSWFDFSSFRDEDLKNATIVWSIPLSWDLYQYWKQASNYIRIDNNSSWFSSFTFLIKLKKTDDVTWFHTILSWITWTTDDLVIAFKKDIDQQTISVVWEWSSFINMSKWSDLLFYDWNEHEYIFQKNGTTITIYEDGTSIWTLTTSWTAFWTNAFVIWQEQDSEFWSFDENQSLASDIKQFKFVKSVKTVAEMQSLTKDDSDVYIWTVDFSSYYKTLYLQDDGWISFNKATIEKQVWKWLNVNNILVWVSNAVDFVTFSTSWWTASYTTSYTHNLGKVPSKFELHSVSSTWDITSHWYYEHWEYWCVWSQSWAREDWVGIIHYAAGDYFLMTLTNITDRWFDIIYTEIWNCNTTIHYCLMKLT